MSSSQIITSIISVVIGVVVGWYIGNRRGRPALGAVLGLLSCIGWIIIAVIPAKDSHP